MKFTVPFEPQSAMRPNYSSETGRPSHLFMPPQYRKWRDTVSLWFEDWLFDTDYALLKECLYLKDGRNIRDQKTGSFRPEFYGYEFKAMFVLKPSKNGRPFPIAQRSSDIDNYAKAVVDMIFESQSFKNAKLNDKYIQSMILLKRCAREGEKPRIDVELTQID